MQTVHGIAQDGARTYSQTLQGVTAGRVTVTLAAREDAFCVGLYESPPYDLQVAAMAHPRLSINLASTPACGGICGGPERTYAARRYSMFLTPAGADAHWRKAQPSRHLNFYFDPRFIEDESANGARGFALDEPLFDVQVARMRPWIDALASTIRCESTAGLEATLSLSHLILGALAQAPHARSPALADDGIARICDYIDAHLAAPIRITDLAALLGLPAGRFGLRFKATTGQTPHRFVMARRAARAIQLLRDRKRGLDLVEIALQCGFCSQQHFTTVVRQITGCTPGQLRRGAASKGC